MCLCTRLSGHFWNRQEQNRGFKSNTGISDLGDTLRDFVRIVDPYDLARRTIINSGRNTPKSNFMTDQIFIHRGHCLFRGQNLRDGQS